MMSYMRQIAERLTQDKKKMCVMASLMAVLLLLWGRLILKEVPRTAVADPVMSKMIDRWNLHAFAESRVMLSRVEVELPTSLSRDLFTLDLASYVSTETKPVVEVKVEKSGSKVADEKRKADEVRVAATGLKLQTTIMAGNKLALINDKLVRQGDEVKGFVVIEILHRHVVLRMNGIEITLEM